jgi:16S rRNA processing protein RimM
MEFEKHYYLGAVIKTHALKGNVVLFLDTDEPNFYKKLKKLYIKKEGILSPFFIETAKLLPNGNLLVKLEGVGLDEALALVKKEIFLPIEELPPLSGNKFYYHEIIDFLAKDEKDLIIGVIKNVNDQTPQALFEIENKEAQQILIPIVDEWLLQVNRQEKFIKLQLPDGLVDLYTKSV